MSRFLSSALAAIALNGTALAQNGPTSIPSPTRDWGCEVLLCLANPNGPTAVAQCVPPIQRLWRELARGRTFPSCAMASGPNGRSYAQLANRRYDPCPAGTGDLAPGQFAELNAPMRSATAPTTRSGTVTTYTAASPGLIYAGIGDGDGPGRTGIDGAPPIKVCVAGDRGTREVMNGDNTYTVNLYDTIYVSPAHASPMVIDVYVDNVYWQSVR